MIAISARAAESGAAGFRVLGFKASVWGRNKAQI